MDTKVRDGEAEYSGAAFGLPLPVDPGKHELVIEAQGRGVPIVAMPYTNVAMANHPAFLENIARLRGWGIAVLFGEDVVRFLPPGFGEAAVEGFPWKLALDVLRGMTAVPRPRR